MHVAAQSSWPNVVRPRWSGRDQAAHSPHAQSQVAHSSGSKDADQYGLGSEKPGARAASPVSYGLGSETASLRGIPRSSSPTPEPRVGGTFASVVRDGSAQTGSRTVSPPNSARSSISLASAPALRPPSTSYGAAVSV